MGAEGRGHDDVDADTDARPDASTHANFRPGPHINTVTDRGTLPDPDGDARADGDPDRQPGHLADADALRRCLTGRNSRGPGRVT